MIFWFKDTLSNEIQLLNQKGGVFKSFGGGILYFRGLLSLEKCLVSGKKLFSKFSIWKTEFQFLAQKRVGNTLTILRVYYTT